MRRKVAAMVVGAMLVVTRAAADPEVPAEVDDHPRHLLSSAACVTAAGSALTLRADSTILQPGQWEALDAALRSAQTAETRLGAENRKLRQLADKGPGWGVLTAVVAGLAVGTAAGAYIVTR